MRSSQIPAQDPAEADIRVRFHSLVKSPLRASLLRLLHEHPDQTFALNTLKQRVGHMQRDVENCMLELETFGLAQRRSSTPPQYAANSPSVPIAQKLLNDFLVQRGHPSQEDQSPAVQRFRELIGNDEKMLVVFEWIRMAAKSDIAVLVLGPTGTGKEVVARMIHELSQRGPDRFQAVNCAALPDSLFESEMFGYEKGAFTGANDRKPGRIELANNGTLFLDEIGDLSPTAQAKLLRVLEDRQVERLGSRHSIAVDFRLISATNQPLDQFIQDRRFREDLYYRVNAFSIRLPSLRERASDIPLLARRLLARYCESNGLDSDEKTLADDAIARLGEYHWPGNIRELESTVARAAVSTPGHVITANYIHFLHPIESATAAPSPQLVSLREAERLHVQRVLDAMGWNKKQAARTLGISRGTLYRKILDYELKPGGPTTATERGDR